MERELLSLSEHMSLSPFLVGFVLFSLKRSIYCFVFIFGVSFWPLHCVSFFDLRFLITLFYLDLSRIYE